MDSVKFFSKAEGRMPFALLDGHSSHVEMKFLTYMDDNEHEWVMRVGSPCGAILWKVAHAIYFSYF